MSRNSLSVKAEEMTEAFSCLLLLWKTEVTTINIKNSRPSQLAVGLALGPPNKPHPIDPK